ncbi:MAG: Smr/MutS family protein [Deltaproteobacteria bacterium]|nr:Smr/MutS family protein [Deltaproteobacteria bacterium]MBF0523803.1 Smr/MutS family protein [Deltaproteobacteria bacterium]
MVEEEHIIRPEENPFGDEPVVVPIADVLDLHSFSPREVKSLLEYCLEEWVRQGFAQVRIIHGKGQGVMRDTVRAFLSRSPRVRGFHPGDEQSGGWGTTVVYPAAVTGAEPEKDQPLI